ncbi:polyprotein [Plakobranchus ocellatus]|uniref:Polyprotein n=1 Tax=Plakobranchus ocellatus TaxID=259542 RepID=A0AAV4ATN3_9GAST|nr:polyprotein [Plakobranchus ocellatus]
MIFADYLSRVCPTSAGNIELDKIVHQVSISDEKYKALQEATANDTELVCLRSQIMKGWPDSVKEVPHTVRKYWSMRDFLSVEDGLIIKNTAIIIPKSMISLILEKLHEGHQGIEKCLLRARENVFWLGMTKDITGKVRECSICEKYNKKSQQKQPLMQHEVPSGPFEKDTNTGLWSPATIVKETEEPRRYLIETPDGTTLRRNRLHLKDSARTRPAKPPPQADDDEAGDSAASATEGESVRRSSDSIPDPQATEYITDLCPGSSNPPGPMIETPSTTVRNNRIHTRSGRTIKPPKRYVDE